MNVVASSSWKYVLEKETIVTEIGEVNTPLRDEINLVISKSKKLWEGKHVS